MTSSKCILSCKYHHNQNTEYFHHLLKYTIYPFVVNPQPHSGPTDLFFGTTVWLFLKFHKNGIKQQVVSGNGFFHLD